MADEEEKIIEIEENSPELKEKEKKEEEAIKSLVVVVTETNKKLDDIYDETLKRVETKKKLLPTDERVEEEHKTKVQIMNEKYEELKSRISTDRREGKDVIIADFMSRNIPSKIKMAQVTREKKDFDLVELLIKQVYEELSSIEKDEILNVKKELEHKYKEMMQKETGKVTTEDD